MLDHATTFQFAPYDNSNVLYLTSVSNSATLALNSPAACKSLSVLAASAQGGGDGTLVIHFTDGTTSSAIAFNAANYLTTNTPGAGAAITNFGLLLTGNYNEYSTVLTTSVHFPNLYQTTINLHSLGLDTKQISSVTFTMPNGAGTTANTVTGVFALSGTASEFTRAITLVTVIASPVNGGIVGGGVDLCVRQHQIADGYGQQRLPISRLDGERQQPAARHPATLSYSMAAKRWWRTS